MGLSSKMQENEIAMWEAAKARNKERFLELVDSSAVMVCGGYRCTGAEYAEIIQKSDLSEYEITSWEVVKETEELVQVHYMIETHVNDSKNADLEGIFHITSFWYKINGIWKLFFNMDSRICTMQ